MQCKHKTGFTLVEMLVVTSIISILSSTVLGVVNTARIKSEDVARSKVLNEYIKTLYLIYDETGNYPPLNPLVSACLGYYDDGGCGLNNGDNVNSYFNSLFKNYLSTLPSFKPVTGAQGVHEGPTYRCGATEPPANTKCIAAAINYYVPANEQCAKTSAITSGGAVYSWEPEVRGCQINITLQN